jgi:hypothetical protein
MRVQCLLVSVVALFYVEHIYSISNAVGLIYVFGVIEQIWVLLDQPLVAFEVSIVDLVHPKHKIRALLLQQNLTDAYAIENSPCHCKTLKLSA